MNKIPNYMYLSYFVRLFIGLSSFHKVFEWQFYSSTVWYDNFRFSRVLYNLLYNSSYIALIFTHSWKITLYFRLFLTFIKVVWFCSCNQTKYPYISSLDSIYLHFFKNINLVTLKYPIHFMNPFQQRFKKLSRVRRHYMDLRNR